MLDTFPVFVYVSGICIRFRYLYTFPVFVYVSGRDPAGNRPDLKAFLEAPSGGRIHFRILDIFLEAPSGGRINFRILDIL